MFVSIESKPAKILNWYEPIKLDNGNRMGNKIDTEQLLAFQDEIDAIEDIAEARERAEEIIELLNDRMHEEGLLDQYCQLYGEDVISPDITFDHGKSFSRSSPKSIRIKPGRKLSKQFDEEQHGMSREGTVAPYEAGKFHGFNIRTTKKQRPRICFSVRVYEYEHETIDMNLYALGDVAKTQLNFRYDVREDQLDESLENIFGIRDMQARRQISRIHQLLAQDHRRPMIIYEEVSQMVEDITSEFKKIAYNKPILDSIARMLEFYMIEEKGEYYEVSAGLALKNGIENDKLSIEIQEEVLVVGEVHGVILFPSIKTINEENVDNFAPYLVVAPEMNASQPGDITPILVPFSHLESLEMA